MKTRLPIMLVAALVASVLAPAAVKAAPAIPAEPNIVDPLNDANFVNPSTLSPAPVPRDNVTPADGATVSDILAVWFTHTADTVSLHIHTERPAPASTSINYQVYSSPGEGPVAANTTGCLRWVNVIPGMYQGQQTTYQDAPHIQLVDRCHDGASIWDNGVAGEYVIDTLDDGTGILTSTFPRSYSPLLADGKSITAPRAAAWQIAGGGGAGFAAPAASDDTEIGTDYLLTGGSATEEPPPVVEPPGKNDPPGQGNQNCAKIKDKKKKKACKKNSGKGPKGPKSPPANGCAAYAPGELGAEAETAVVTDAATEDEPMVIDIPMGAALGKQGPYDQSKSVPYNVQLDSKNPEAGLFMKLVSPTTDDPDLYVYWNNGKQAAVAGGFNQALFAGPLPGPLAVLNGTGSGGHSGFGYEQIDGLRTADCAGWDLNLVNWGGQGGTYKLQLWVGEIQNDPAPRE